MSEVKKKIISLEVRGEYILGSGVAIGAEGSFDSVYLRVKFDEYWLGLNIYATWQDALGNVGNQTIVTALDLVDGEPDTYDIPVTQFVTNYPGTVRLALTGYTLGGGAGNEIETLTNTVSGAFRVLKSGAIRLDGGNVPASVVEQVQDAVSRAASAVAEAEDTNTDTKELLDDAEEAENTRKLNENARKANEQSRQSAENERVSAETERANAENERVSAETERGQALEKHIQDPAYEGLHGRLKPGKGAYSVRSATSQKDDASGQGALSLGYGTEASGYHAAAIGVNTTASGYHAFATGKDTEASGESSSAHGEYTSAKEKRQFVVGSFNADEATATFIVGVGQNTAERNNAFSAGFNKETGLKYITVGAQVLTEEQVSLLLELLDRYEIDIGDISTTLDSTYATKAEVSEQIGDISTTLDSILAIQESLIGGDE